MSRPVDALIEFLRAEEARGVSHVHLDQEARVVLRELNNRARGGPPSQVAAPVSRQRIEKAVVREVESEAIRRPVLSLEDAPSKPAPIRTVSEVFASGGTTAERIASLKRQAEDWAPAKALGSLRTTMVFSTGNPEAELMLVGEAPGYQEERQQEPFVGPAGQKLNDILKAMGLPRETVYISNIVKFRPAMPGQTTNNRPPDDVEMASCLPFIRAEIGIVKPKCIVALGGSAAKGLLGRDEAVARLRGSWHEFEGVPVRVTYHPSYLLRGTSGNEDKRKVWEDMLTVMEQLGLPISDKQRGYFTK